MGMVATTDNLTYARNDYIKQGRHHVLDKAADIVYYILANNDIAMTLSNADPISFSATTTGIDFTSTFTKGIVMGTTGGSGTEIALGTLAASWYGIEMCVSASLGSYECHAVRAEVRTSAASASGNINVGRFDCIIKHNIKSAEAVNATVQFTTAASTMSGRVAVGYFSLYSASGIGLTKSDNDISGVMIQHWLQDDPGTMTASYFNSALQISIIGGSYCDYGQVFNVKTSQMTACILISADDSAVIPSGIRFEDQGGGTGGSVTSALYFDSSCGMTNLLEWEAVGGCSTANTHSIDSHALQHIITVKVGTDTGYIPVFDAVPA